MLKSNGTKVKTITDRKLKIGQHEVKKNNTTNVGGEHMP